jgi:bifunctional non-homologous end joining protein LigD
MAAPPPYRPQLALLVKQAPTGDDWFHEIKLDGFRIGVTIDRGEVTLMSRLGNEWTEGFAGVVAGAKRLGAKSALIDGELASILPDGRTSIRAMGNGQTVYFAFDLLFVDGEDLTDQPLEERKRRLQRLLGPEPPDPFRYVEHVVTDGPAFLGEACRLRLEGIVSKLRTAPYRPGARNATWQKSKCVLRQEFVIGGYEHSTVGNLGALWLGYHDPAGRLVYAGKVGTGFQRTSRELLASLAPLARKLAPFDVGLPKGHKIRDAIWVEPRLVAEVAFMEWTGNDHIRHGSFQAMRPDKDPREVVREVPAGD